MLDKEDSYPCIVLRARLEFMVDASVERVRGGSRARGGGGHNLSNLRQVRC